MTGIGPSPHNDAFHGLLCAALRGESPAWPLPTDDTFLAACLTDTAAHGVQSLLHLRIQPGSDLDWPGAFKTACHQQAIAQVMWEMRHQQLLSVVLTDLAATGIRPVLFKGTALAYSLYPTPYVRTRGDTDFIVPLGTQVEVETLLGKRGFVRAPGVSGELISYQTSFTLMDAVSGPHTIDLHWRIANSQLLSGLLSHDELLAESVPLPSLCPEALGAGPAHALLIACMHRAVHKQAPYYVDEVAYHGSDRLIWLYDIHLLLKKLSEESCRRFLSLADRKGLVSVCQEGIKEAAACFDTQIPAVISAALGFPAPEEKIARYLNASAARQLMMDFLSIPGIHQKVRFLNEVAFPPADYMRWKYREAGHAWLPWLYLRRAISGALNRMRNSTRHDH